MAVSFPITIDGSAGSATPSEYDLTTRAGKGARITATEYDDTIITIREALNDLDGRVGGSLDILQDTTPQLGGNLDVNEKSIVCEFGTLTSDHTASGDIITATAGENVVFGSVCYLKSDGKFWKTDADAEATSASMIVMAIATIAGNGSGLFLKRGYARDDTWAWTAGNTLYLSTTPGAMTATAPSGTGDIVRIAGYAKAADYIEFDPSKIYLEIA